ncbi:MAG TPA: ABC transporter ATP-binding protein [Vicinamibacterales bacterium]|jgi:iron complex transport system ATP-binding protein|nr:ABC transporter ATP-binding protein [Vicinamibacterales bacterium]
MLRAADVSFSYEAAPVLHRVSFVVSPGRIVGLLGPNGSGKTTLLRIMAGTLSPRSGSVQIDEADISTLSRRDVAKRLAVVPQETHSTFDFTVLDIVLMGRYPHLGAFELEGGSDLAIARDALAATGTLALEHRLFATLSGGEKQRVVIAGALAQASHALLLDEPTASLDLGYQLAIAQLLTRLNHDRGTTMLVSTHDLNFAASLCSELVLIRDGRIIAQGATDVVLTVSNVRAVYDVDAEVGYNARAGHVTVIPIARAH